MTLSRRDLEEGRMRAVYAAAVDPSHALTDEELAASLATTLKRKPPRSAWWVFAYGSLLWNPLFPFEEARPATLRADTGVSASGRSLRAAPPLNPGWCSAWIAAARVTASSIDCRRASRKTSCMLLWRREMVLGAYQPLWVTVRCGQSPLVALAFVVDRTHRQYTGKLTLGEQAEVLASAAGAFGSSADYLERTRVALITHGIVDPYLERLRCWLRGDGSACAVAIAQVDGRRPAQRRRRDVGHRPDS